jgi:hypothetical protein
MAHVLAKMTGVPVENIRRQLENDAAEHAKEGMFLEQLWQNSENPAEVLFLFRVDDLAHCLQLMKHRHAEARRQSPGVPLPEMTFLDRA